LIIFASLETGMNILPSRYKLFHFNFTMSPLYLIKLKIAQTQPTAYCSIQLNRLFQNFTESRSMFVSFCICLTIPLAVFQEKIFYILVGFIKNLFSNSIWLILTCKLKLDCRDMRHVTVMTSSS